MKIHTSLRRALAPVLLLVTITANAQTTKFTLSETGRPVSVNVNPTGTAIVVTNAKKLTTFKPRATVSRIPTDRQSATPTQIPGTKIDPSRAFFHADIHGQTLLIFPSEEATSNAPPTFILGFKADGTPYKLLEHDEWDISFVGEGPSGTAKIIGRNISEPLCDSNMPGAPNSATYDPYSVFVAAPGAPAVYYLRLSRAYNLRHYVWAGPMANEKYAVVSNLPGHPVRFLMRDQEQACKLVTSALMKPASGKTR